MLTEQIRSKPNLHFRDFPRWPPFDISNIFINFVQHGNWYDILFYRKPTSTILKMAAIPANFNFQSGSIADNVLHDIGFLKLFLLLYADDIVIFSETEQGLHEGLNVLSKYCEEWKLVVYVNKTKVMVFRKRGRLKRELRFYYITTMK